MHDDYAQANNHEGLTLRLDIRTLGTVLVNPLVPSSAMCVSFLCMCVEKAYTFTDVKPTGVMSDVARLSYWSYP